MKFLAKQFLLRPSSESSETKQVDVLSPERRKSRDREV